MNVPFLTQLGSFPTMLSKRHLFSMALEWSGIQTLVQALPKRPGLLVLNYHRVGDSMASEYDRGVFSASADEFEKHLAFLGKHFCVIGLDEAIALLQRPTQLKQFHVLLTFDDGYRDNFNIAIPLLLAYRHSAVFFVAIQLVGSSSIPWWDEVAFLIRRCPKRAIDFSYPTLTRLELSSDREPQIQKVLRMFMSPEVKSEFLMESLRNAAGIELPKPVRRFMDWDEIRKVADQGMDIGSHTVSHSILSQLTPDQRLRELVDSKAEIESRIARPVRSVAYPVGERITFGEVTERLVLKAGYEAAFSFYGGFNEAGKTRLTDIRRTSNSAAPTMFRTEAIFISRFGKLPYPSGYSVEEGRRT